MILDPDHPLAIALKRSMPGMLSANVGRQFTLIEYKDRVVRHRTSQRLREALLHYEATGEFVEGSYTLEKIR